VSRPIEATFPLEEDGGTVSVTTQIDDMPVSEAPPPPGRHRHHWVLLTMGAVGVIVLLVLAVPYVLYVRRSHPGARSVNSAVQRYRATTSTAAGAGDLVGPRPGVYQAEGSGTEHISFPPNSQKDGAVMPITVTALPGGCWRWHIDYNTAHWHEYDFCAQGGSLLLVAQRNYQRWDFGALKVTNLGSYTCSPPAPVMANGAGAGTRFEHHCTGTNTAVAGKSIVDGPVTLAGTVTLDIGGQKVEAVRQTRVEHLSGAQKGT